MLDMIITDQEYKTMQATVLKMVSRQNHTKDDILAMVQYDVNLTKHIKGWNPTGKGRFIELDCQNNELYNAMILQGIWCPKHREWHRIFPNDMENRTIITMFNVPLTTQGARLKQYIELRGYEVSFTHHVLESGYRTGVMKFMVYKTTSSVPLPEYVECYRRKIGVRHKEQLEVNPVDKPTPKPVKQNKRQKRREAARNKALLQSENTTKKSLPNVREEVDMEVEATQAVVEPAWNLRFKPYTPTPTTEVEPKAKTKEVIHNNTTAVKKVQFADNPRNQPQVDNMDIVNPTTRINHDWSSDEPLNNTTTVTVHHSTPTAEPIRTPTTDTLPKPDSSAEEGEIIDDDGDNWETSSIDVNPPDFEPDDFLQLDISWAFADPGTSDHEQCVQYEDVKTESPEWTAYLETLMITTDLMHEQLNDTVCDVVDEEQTMNLIDNDILEYYLRDVIKEVTFDLRREFADRLLVRKSNTRRSDDEEFEPKKPTELPKTPPSSAPTIELDSTQPTFIQWGKYNREFAVGELTSYLEGINEHLLSFDDTERIFLSYIKFYDKGIPLPPDWSKNNTLAFYATVVAHYVGRADLDTTPTRFTKLFNGRHSNFLGLWRMWSKTKASQRTKKLNEYISLINRHRATTPQQQ